MIRILLVHGLGAEPDSFDALVAPIRARVPAARIERPRLADRFPDAVDAVADWMAAGPGVVVGHSMGGHVALCAARRIGRGHPLVLLAPGGVGPAPPPGAVWAVWSRAALAARSADDYERAMRQLYGDPQHPWADRRAAVHRARAGTAAGDRWIERVVTQVAGVLRAWIGDASETPGTLYIVRGARDPMVTDAPLAALASRHPAGSFERWDGVGHMLPDEAPDRVAALVAQAASGSSSAEG